MKEDHAGVCKMCGSTAILRFSHILPELCYLAAYDSKHRATKLTTDEKRHPPLQKGIREYLLCDACEGKLGKLESAFKKYWYDGPALAEPISYDGPVITGFDYTQFKLFHLSILWRASVSKLREFGTVNLGPYEDRIRKMLLAGDAGPVDQFPIFAMVLTDENQCVAYGLITKTQKSKFDGIHIYYACYAGCEWNAIVTDHIHGDLREILPGFPQANGTMRLGAQDWTRSNSIRAFLEDRSRQRRRATT